MANNTPLVNGEIYHIFNKSIAGYRIFNDRKEYLRMLNLVRYYQIKELPCSFSQFSNLEQTSSMGFDYCFYAISNNALYLVEVLAYCLMPTHFHLILKQVCDDGISVYLNNLLNSYTRFFNLTHKRKGPLWVGRFGRRLIKSDEDFLQMSRYVHLNPTTAGLVEKAEHWEYSSYKEYLQLVRKKDNLCHGMDLIDMDSKSYQEFIEDYVGYQKELAKIKHLIME